MTPTQAPRITVLVVDDDEGVRAMLLLALPRFGITALFASSGEEAVKVYRSRGPSVDLVLSDVRMGVGMDGPQTVAVLREMNPGLRFCFMSGDSGDYTDADMLALGAARIFRKPFMNVGELARKLRELREAVDP